MAGGLSVTLALIARLAPCRLNFWLAGATDREVSRQVVGHDGVKAPVVDLFGMTITTHNVVLDQRLGPAIDVETGRAVAVDNVMAHLSVGYSIIDYETAVLVIPDEVIIH